MSDDGLDEHRAWWCGLTFWQRIMWGFGIYPKGNPPPCLRGES